MGLTGRRVTALRGHELPAITSADARQGLSSGKGHGRQASPRLHPLSDHEELSQTGQGRVHAPADQHTHGLRSQEPSLDGALPVARDAFIGEGCSHIHHLDLTRNAREAIVQDGNDRFGSAPFLPS